MAYFLVSLDLFVSCELDIGEKDQPSCHTFKRYENTVSCWERTKVWLCSRRELIIMRHLYQAYAEFCWQFIFQL